MVSPCYIRDVAIKGIMESSLIPVSTFSSVTAARYFLSGEIDLPVALLFVLGGMIGDFMGQRYHQRCLKTH